MWHGVRGEELGCDDENIKMILEMGGQIRGKMGREGVSFSSFSLALINGAGYDVRFSPLVALFDDGLSSGVVR